jgi:hypothetical protein
MGLLGSHLKAESGAAESHKPRFFLTADRRDGKSPQSPCGLAVTGSGNVEQ